MAKALSSPPPKIGTTLKHCPLRAAPVPPFRPERLSFQATQSFVCESSTLGSGTGRVQPPVCPLEGVLSSTSLFYNVGAVGWGGLGFWGGCGAGGGGGVPSDVLTAPLSRATFYDARRAFSAPLSRRHPYGLITLRVSSPSLVTSFP